MNKMHKNIVVLFSVFIIIICLGIVIQASEKPIKIGSLLSLSAVEPVVSEEKLRGQELAIEEIGEIQGRPLELIVADVTSLEVQRTEAMRLVNEGVIILLDSSKTPWDKAVVPIAERNKVIFWLNLDGGTEITKPGSPWVFRVNPLSIDEGELQARWFVDDILPRLDISKEDVRIGLVYRDDSWGVAMAKEAGRVLRELGFNIVVEEYYGGEEIRDMSPVILKMKDQKINVVLMGHYREAGMLFWKAARRYNFNPLISIGTGAFESTDQPIQILGKNGVEGLLGTNYPAFNTSTEVGPGIPKILKKYKEKYGHDPYTCHALSEYTGMMILFDALKRTEDLDDIESIKSAILKTDIPMYTLGVGWGAKFSTFDEPYRGMAHQNMRSFLIGCQFQDGIIWTIYPKPYPGRKLIVPIPTWDDKQ